MASRKRAVAATKPAAPVVTQTDPLQFAQSILLAQSLLQGQNNLAHLVPGLPAINNTVQYAAQPTVTEAKKKVAKKPAIKKSGRVIKTRALTVKDLEPINEENLP